MSLEKVHPNTAVDKAQRARRLIWRAGALGLLVVGTSAFLPVTSSEFRASTSSIGNTIAGDRLEPPTNLAISGSSIFVFSWGPIDDDSVVGYDDDYVVGYRLYRAELAGGPYALIADVTSTSSTNLTDTPPPGSYFYVLRAYYRSWESSNSNEVGSTP